MYDDYDGYSDDEYVERPRAALQTIIELTDRDQEYSDPEYPAGFHGYDD